MRNYQPQKRNPYKLPQALYMRMLYLVRDYERLKTNPDPPCHISDELNAVEQALRSIPQEYQQGVWENVVHRASYPLDAGEATYKRWRCRFIYSVAENLGLI